MATLFSYHGNDLAELRQAFSRVNRSEFCESDLSLAGSRPHRFRIDRAIAQPVSVMRLSANTTMSFRRTQQHIRANNAGVRFILFVRSGSFKIVQSQRCLTINAGQCAILDSTQPYFAQADVDNGKMTFEAVVVVVSAHMFISHLANAMSLDCLLPVNGNLVHRLIDLLLDEGESLGKETAAYLAIALLEALDDMIDTDSIEGARRRQKVVDKRLGDIVSYITKHFTNPDLTYDEVANQCGISPRYLCHVLKANDTSFSNLVWNQRLPQARDWLIANNLQDYSIQEIAYMAGFKSAAHFSRMFKDHYGCSPKTFRIQQFAEQAVENNSEVQDNFADLREAA